MKNKMCVCVYGRNGPNNQIVSVYLLCYGTISRAILMVFNACLSLHIVIIEIVVLCHTVFVSFRCGYFIWLVVCFVSNEIAASYFIRYPMI